MSGIERLHLEDAYEDSPQTKSLLGVFEKDASLLNQYTQGFFQSCQRLLNAQKEICSATQSMSQNLKAYEAMRFPLDNDGSILTDTLKQFSLYLDELSSVHQILATQLADGMMYPISKFLQADIDEINSMADKMKHSSHEHDQALSRYMKVSKKKENEKSRQESNEDLYVYRKKKHQTALHYYSSLNALQYKRKYALLEPMLAYIQAQKAFFEMGKETVDKQDIDDFLGNINASCQGVRAELTEETLKTVEQIDTIEKNSRSLYQAEPSQDAPLTPPNPELSQKAGYLFMRSKKALIATSWDRGYFFIQGGNIMCQMKEEVAGSLVLDLSEQGTVSEPSEVDDRKNIFTIVQPFNKKTVILQAESEKDRDEWIMTINNVVKESLGAKSSKDLNLAHQVPRKGSKSSTASGDKKSSDAVSIPANKALKEVLVNTPGAPPTPPSTPADGGFIPDAPIVFDMISPSDETKHVPGDMDRPQKRINPFDQASGSVKLASSEGNPAFQESFEVRFCGSMQVRTDRGEHLVLETIRQIMAARALHNIFKMTESQFLVSSDGIRLVDPSNNVVRAEFSLQDVSFWAPHTENKRLFGFVTRTKAAGDSTYSCHVFECNASADEICHALSAATKLAFQALMEKKTQEKQSKAMEKQILMDNIEQLEDDDDAAHDPPTLSDDGSNQEKEA